MTGVYRWGAPNGPGQVDKFSTWLGGSVTMAEDFQAGDTWSNSKGAGWQLGPWHNRMNLDPNRRFILNIPIIPSS